MDDKIDPKLKKQLSGKNWYFVLRTGKKLLFCSITKPKFAITMELMFKKEENAIAVEGWYNKKFGGEKKG